VDSVISQQDVAERDTIAQIKARFNDTPLRRILARQTSREVPLMRDSPTLKQKEDIASPVDSVISEQDAAGYTEPSVSEHRQERTEQWASAVDDGLEVLQMKSVPVKRSNTPLRRILERQVSVSVSLERRLKWS
jgi:hypothetical protein